MSPDSCRSDDLITRLFLANLPQLASALFLVPVVNPIPHPKETTPAKLTQGTRSRDPRRTV